MKTTTPAKRLTTAEVAARAGCTPSNIRYLRLRNRMPTAKLVEMGSGRAWMWTYDEAEIEEWLTTRRRVRRG